MADQMAPAEMRGRAHSLRVAANEAESRGLAVGDLEMRAFIGSVRAGADALDRLASEAEARERDAAHPEFVPEAVMDAAFESQASWWRPGETPAVMAVLVPQLIETVAAAAYAATREVRDVDPH